MKDALYFAIIFTAYGTGLLVILFTSFEKISLVKALSFNLMGGVIVFVVLSIAAFFRKQ